MRPEHVNCRCTIIESGASVTSRVVATVTDTLLWRVGRDQAREVTGDALLAEARRRYPYCDLRLYREDWRGAWFVEAGGYIEGEAGNVKLGAVPPA